jgi:hypothetical protein
MLTTYIIIVCLALSVTSITGTLFALDQATRIILGDKQFFWVAGIFHLSALMSIVFIGNLCAVIAGLN